jgi:hypothetical protein
MGLIESIMRAESEFTIHGDLHIAELVTFTPQGGSPRTISAIVERNAPAPGRESDKIRIWRYRITVRNDNTYGVSSSATSILRGTFAVVKRHGHADTETLTINADTLASQSAGYLTFEWA